MSGEEDPFIQFEKDNNNRRSRGSSRILHDVVDDNEEEDIIRDDEENIDFYAVLNVSREATANEIQIAYKKLAFTYHPDKQVDPVLKVESQNKFALISMARDTLCDEKQRAIYDRYGISGLNNSQAIINKYEEVDNLLRAMGKIQRSIKEEKEMDNFSGRGQQSIDVGYYSEYNKVFMNKFDTSQTFTLNSSYATVDVTPSFSHNYLQNSSVFACGALARVPLSHRVQLITGVTYSEAHPLQGIIGLNTLVTKHTLGQFSIVSLNLHPVEARASLTRQIGPEVTATAESAFSVMGKSLGLILQRNIENRILNLHITANSGGYGNGIETNITRELPLSKKTYIAFSIGAKGLGFKSISASISRRLSKVLELDLTMKVSSSKFTYIIGLRHKYQSIEIPIPIYTDVSIKTSLLFFTVPSVILSVFKLLILNPISKRKENKNLEEKKQKYVHSMEKEKQRAAMDIQLMKPTVEKKVALERSKNGLIIQEAWYGVLDANGRPVSDHQQDFPAFIDVGVPLQYLVEDSKLELHPNKKSDLLGFYDPRIGENKRLKVTYFFQGKQHQVIIEDQEYMRLPLRSHLIN